MVFSSLIFLYAFLPLSLAVYALCRSLRAKNISLLVFSLIFYAWGGPRLVLLLMGMTLVCYIGARMIARAERHRRLWLALTLVISLGLLAVFKYTGFLLENIRSLVGFPEVIPQITLPIGISFYTFQLISYVVDVYRREVPAQKNYALLLLYAALFHQCIAGPIVRYKTIDQELFSGQPRHVYAIDYRKYWRYGMAEFVDKYDIDDVIVAPYLIATQAMDGNDMFRSQMH